MDKKIDYEYEILKHVIIWLISVVSFTYHINYHPTILTHPYMILLMVVLGFLILLSSISIILITYKRFGKSN